VPVDLRAKRIGVLLGGLSGEREVSLRSGENCYRALASLGYDVVRVDALRDVARRLVDEGIEVAFLALHGRFGEDGTIQGLLEVMGIPYTGSGVLASALGMHKIAAKKVVRQSGVPTPDFCEIGANEPAGEAGRRVAQDLGLPVMLKPVEEGSSLGVSKCDDVERLSADIETGRRTYGCVFAERYVPGTEITVGVLEREEGLMALPILELIPHNEFYDYEAKYTDGMTDFVIPARLPEDVYEEAQRLATAAFTAIGCRGYARVDFMVAADGVPYFTELNSLPGMTDLSDLPAQARAAGIDYEQLVESILNSVLLRPGQCDAPEETVGTVARAFEPGSGR
jgi:D-alanine-D-alanine ligase